MKSLSRWINTVVVASMAACGAGALVSSGLAAQAASDLTPDQSLGRAILRQLIEINTTNSVGNTTVAAEAMAKRLLDAGYPPSDVQVIGPRAKNRNLVVRLRGSGAHKPLLLLAHLDVVEARREDWSLDPFTFTERDGFFYGRGTSDVKDGAAVWVATMIRLKREGYRPDRDVILALTAGEESSEDYNGVQWLLTNHRELVDADLCINADAGDPQIKDGKRIERTVQVSEKVFQSFRLEVHNPGGHSSLPTRDNAIYRLAEALVHLSRYQFPVALNEATHGYFEATAPIAGGQVGTDMRAVLATPPDSAAVARLSAVPLYNALLRTTCVATMLDGGHAENALPQTAGAIVNCRILPNESAADVRSTVVRIINDTAVSVKPAAPAKPSPPSPLSPAVMGPIRHVTDSLWPGVPIVPVMETGATDGLYFRNAGIPTYGVSGVSLDIDDIRAHGRDERILVKAFYDALPYEYALVKALTKS